MAGSLQVPDDPPHALSIAAVAQLVRTDADHGLSQHEAAARLAAWGRNELREEPVEAWWERLLRQFQSPLVYLLVAAIAVSMLAWALEGASGWPLDALVIGAIMAANAVIGYVQEGKAASAVAELRAMVTEHATVVRDGQNRLVPTTEIVVGDVILLGEGDVVPADARLAQSHLLAVGEAILTGESEPVVKQVEPVAPAALVGDRADMVFGATAVTSGRGRAIVTATGMNTEVGGIATMLGETEAPPTPLEVEIERVGRFLGVAVVAVAVVVVLVASAVSGIGSLDEAVELLLIGVSLAVAAVPEGLPAVLSLVLALGVRRMADRKALLKRLAFAETLGSTTVICVDKTGTLTRNEMAVRVLETPAGRYTFAGLGYDPEGELASDRAELDPTGAATVLRAAALASDADIVRTEAGWRPSGDPTEAALIVAASRAGVDVNADRLRYQRVDEVPFESVRKRMTTLCVDRLGDDATTLYTKGAPDVVLPLCTRELGSEMSPLTPDRRRRWEEVVGELGTQAYRTLAIASKAADRRPAAPLSAADERELTLLGVVAIQDPPRVEARPAVDLARRAGIRTVMITGDHPTTAARIASEVGISEAGSGPITGAELDELGTSVDEVVAHGSVFSRVSPRHKLVLVERLQADGHVVAMTGDGVNDAPALKAADIGIAMGVAGSDVSRGAADMILTDDNIATIVAAVEEGRAIFSNIASFLRYLLSSNMGEVMTMFFGVVLAAVIGLDMGADEVVTPLLATQILWINLLTDTGPALALGNDPVDEQVMDQPPRGRTDRLIDREMATTVLILGFTMAAAALVMIDLTLPGGLLAGHGDIDEARTGAFTVLVIAQLFNAFNARSDRRSALYRPLSNPWLIATVALSFGLQVLVVHARPLNDAFGTAPLSPTQWLWCAVLGGLVLVASEAQKAMRSRRGGLTRRASAAPGVSGSSAAGSPDRSPHPPTEVAP